MTPDTGTVTLHHGTTLRRARLIEAHGPDPKFREPGAFHGDRAEAFSACREGTTSCPTGLPPRVARDKAALYSDEGGPAVLEIRVPVWIVDLWYADPLAAAVARGGELRFDPESGLNELRGAWPQIKKRVNKL